MKKFLMLPLLFLFSLVGMSQNYDLSKNIDKHFIIAPK